MLCPLGVALGQRQQFRFPFPIFLFSLGVEVVVKLFLDVISDFVYVMNRVLYLGDVLHSAQDRHRKKERQDDRKRKNESVRQAQHHDDTCRREGNDLHEQMYFSFSQTLLLFG